MCPNLNHDELGWGEGHGETGREQRKRWETQRRACLERQEIDKGLFAENLSRVTGAAFQSEEKRKA